MIGKALWLTGRKFDGTGLRGPNEKLKGPSLDGSHFLRHSADGWLREVQAQPLANELAVKCVSL